MTESPRYLTGWNPAAAELARAVGLDPACVRKLEFSLAADGVAILRVESFVDEDQAEKVAAVWRKFRLVEEGEA